MCLTYFILKPMQHWTRRKFLPSQCRPKQDVTTCNCCFFLCMSFSELEISHRLETDTQTFSFTMLLVKPTHTNTPTRASLLQTSIDKCRMDAPAHAIVSQLSFVSFPSCTKVIHHDSIKLGPLVVDEWPGLPVKPWPPSSFIGLVGWSSHFLSTWVKVWAIVGWVVRFQSVRLYCILFAQCRV